MIGSYTQIQTFLSLANKKEFEQALEAYQQLLSQIGYDNPQLEEWLSNSTWNVIEGLGHGDVFSWQPVTVMGQQFRLAPYISGATSDELGSVPGRWVALNIAFPTSDLEVSRVPPGEPTYKPGVGRPLWQVMRIVSSLFSQSGVYLTDELDDSAPWYALLKGKRDTLWSFDLALIPMHLTEVFSSVPSSHQRASFGSGIGFARRKRWLSLPWEEKGAMH
jgi:hypothetical protein